MENERFSNVTWDKDGREGILTLGNGKTAKLEIDVVNDEPIPEATLNSVKFLIENEHTISLKIAASVFKNYRDWCDDDITTSEQLVQRISLTHVSFWDDGGGSIYYEAEDGMFTDHSVYTTFDANGVIDEAEMAG